MRKPRDLEAGFWDGFAQWCDWDPATEDAVNLKLSCASASELKRMAKWMLRAAKWIDKNKKRRRAK